MPTVDADCKIISNNECLNKGRWIKDEHDLFLSGLEQYGCNHKNIATLVKTRTATQIKTHAEKYFQTLSKKEDEKTRLKEFRQYLPPEKKAMHAEEQRKYLESLSPNTKARIQENDAAAHQK
jgi:SHAQKYF class myb-like DNA-binding protein